jgi:hypothetical protein
MSQKMTDNFEEHGTNLFGVSFVFVDYESDCLRIFVALRMSILPKFTAMAMILQPHPAGFMLCLQNIGNCGRNFRIL